MINLNLYFEEEDKLRTIKYPIKGTSKLELMKKIESTGISLPKKIQLMINERELKENEGIYKFSENDTLKIRESINLEGFAFKMEEIKEEKFIKETVTEDDKIPYWLTVYPGLNLLGICPNEKCEAYMKDVIYHVNKNKYDLCENGGIMLCPVCKNQFQLKNVCLYHCYYNYYGSKVVHRSVQEFGKEIYDFDNCFINHDNFVFVNGEKYQIYKTKFNGFNTMLIQGDEVKYVEFFFQIRFFDP